MGYPCFQSIHQPYIPEFLHWVDHCHECADHPAEHGPHHNRPGLMAGRDWTESTVQQSCWYGMVLASHGRSKDPDDPLDMDCSFLFQYLLPPLITGFLWGNVSPLCGSCGEQPPCLTGTRICTGFYLMPIIYIHITRICPVISQYSSKNTPHILPHYWTLVIKTMNHEGGMVIGA